MHQTSSCWSDLMSPVHVEAPSGELIAASQLVMPVKEEYCGRSSTVVTATTLLTHSATPRSAQRLAHVAVVRESVSTQVHTRTCLLICGKTLDFCVDAHGTL